MLLGSVRVMPLPWYLYESTVCSSPVKQFGSSLFLPFKDDMCLIFQSFRNICQCSCKRKKRQAYPWRLKDDFFPPKSTHSQHCHTGDLLAQICVQQIQYPLLTVKRAIFHGSCANCFTSAWAASCDLFPERRTNRCDADDARARAGLPLSPYRLRWRHSPPDINRSNMRPLDAQNQPLHQVSGIPQHIIPLLVMKMLIECSKIRLATQ